MYLGGRWAELGPVEWFTIYLSLFLLICRNKLFNKVEMWAVFWVSWVNQCTACLFLSTMLICAHQHGCGNILFIYVICLCYNQRRSVWLNSFMSHSRFPLTLSWSRNSRQFYDLYDLDLANKSPTWKYPAPCFPVLVLYHTF